MDCLLKDGDYVLDHRGRPMMIAGDAELAQRAMIRLAVKRGSLPFDPSFGSRIFQVRRMESQKKMQQEALSVVRDALAPIGQLQVLSAGCSYDAQNSRLTVQVRAAKDKAPFSLEVMV